MMPNIIFLKATMGNIGYKVKKSRGKLKVTSPDIESFQANLLREKKYHVDSPHHLYVFSILTLYNLLNKFGLRNIRTRHSIPLHNICGWMWNFFRFLNLKFNCLGQNFKRKFLDPKNNYFNLLRFVINVPFKIFFIMESLFERGGTIQITPSK